MAIWTKLRVTKGKGKEEEVNEDKANTFTSHENTGAAFDEVLGIYTLPLSIPRTLTCRQAGRRKL